MLSRGSSEDEYKKDLVEHIKAWRDLVSGLALLYMGKENYPDNLIHRADEAVRTKNMEDMEHLSSILMIQLEVKGQQVPDFAKPKWGELSREYHSRFCKDCFERRICECLASISD